MAPGGKMFRYPQHFGANVLRHGSHAWLPYSKDEVRLKSSNTNLSFWRVLVGELSMIHSRSSLRGGGAGGAGDQLGVQQEGAGGHAFDLAGHGAVGAFAQLRPILADGG